MEPTDVTDIGAIGKPAPHISNNATLGKIASGNRSVDTMEELNGTIRVYHKAELVAASPIGLYEYTKHRSSAKHGARPKSNSSMGGIAYLD